MLQTEVLSKFCRLSRLLACEVVDSRSFVLDDYLEVVREVLLEVGYDVVDLVPKKLYRSDGVTFEIVNERCPIAVRTSRYSVGGSAEEDDVMATSWLELTVRRVGRLPDQEGFLELAHWLEESRPLPPIGLTIYGDVLVELRRLSDHVRDEHYLWEKRASHQYCGGSLEVYRCSPAWSAIVCRTCALRVRIPAAVRTFGDLRRWAGAEATSSASPESRHV